MNSKLLPSQFLAKAKIANENFCEKHRIYEDCTELYLAGVVELWPLIQSCKEYMSYIAVDSFVADYQSEYQLTKKQAKEFLVLLEQFEKGE